MSDQNVMAAMQARLVLFATASGLLIAFEGNTFQADQTKTHLADYLLPANTDSPSLGRGHARFSGIYQVIVDAPADANVVALRNTANAIAAHFPRGQPMTHAGQVVWVPKAASLGPLITGGGRMTRSVTIPYQSDVFTP